jgi:hypothetical protein
MQVHIINGCDFDPNVAGFQGLISTNKEFFVYHFKKSGVGINTQDYRLYHCQFKKCDVIFNNLHKLYDHMRAHISEKPFKC